MVASNALTVNYATAILGGFYADREWLWVATRRKVVISGQKVMSIGYLIGTSSTASRRRLQV
jgi:dipeptide/tripeptide permease